MNGLQASQILPSAQNVSQSSGMLKKCPGCGNVKYIDEFGVNKRNKEDGKSTRCKACNRVGNREGSRRWRENNPEKICRIEKERRIRDRDKIRERTARWRKKNPEKLRLISQRYTTKRRNVPRNRICHSISASILKSLKNNKNGNGWESLLGYTKEQLEKHLEKQFKPGMTWDNYGIHGWHIDHIIPVSAFNFEKPEDEDFKRCWALKNLQPLWANENNKKQNKLYKPFQPSLIFK